MIGFGTHKHLRTLLLISVTLAGLALVRAEEKPQATEAKTTVAFIPAQIEFFEKKVRPLLAESCLDCHTGTKSKVGLELNHREGWLSGSDYRNVVTWRIDACS